MVITSPCEKQKLNHYHLHWLLFNLALDDQILSYYKPVFFSYFVLLVSCEFVSMNLCLLDYPLTRTGTVTSQRKFRQFSRSICVESGDNKIAGFSLCVERISQQLIKQIAD